MKPSLQDERAKLLAEVERLDERIELDECSSLTQSAAEHVETAKRLLAEAAEKDREQKRRELAERDAIAAAKRAKLVSQIAEQERLYREGITRGLQALSIADPLFHPNEAEKNLLANPDKAPVVGLSQAFYRECPAKPSIQYILIGNQLSAFRLTAGPANLQAPTRSWS